MEKVENIYDKLFKVVFTDRKNTKDFLKIYLPADLKNNIDFRKVSIDPNEYIDENMKGEYSDIVVKTKLLGKNNQNADIYILYEHKSYKDKKIFLQLLNYMTAMWKKDFEEKKPPRPIIPLVFYHGKSRWNIPDEFHQQFKVDDEIKKYLLNFKYIFFNTVEHDFNVEKIREFKNNIALYTALMLFKDTFKKNIKILHKIFDFWGKNDFIDKGKEIESQAFYFLIFIAQTRDIPLKKIGQMLDDSNIKGEKIMPTLAQRLEKKGLKKGYKMGKQEGRRDANIETAKKMLKLNHSIKNIAAVTEMSIEEIKEIQKDLNL